jgi:hypothetical protein
VIEPARRSILILLAASLLVGACASGQAVVGPGAPEGKGGGEPSNALPITDIPIPAGAKLDNDASLIMGAQDRWFGRIVIKTENSPTQSYNQFFKGMPGFGWSVVTAVQARISNLTYLRGERVASIQIESSGFGGATISITVSPRQPAQQDAARQK